jgi:hypothetical protein
MSSTMYDFPEFISFTAKNGYKCMCNHCSSFNGSNFLKYNDLNNHMILHNINKTQINNININTNTFYFDSELNSYKMKVKN